MWRIYIAVGENNNIPLIIKGNLEENIMNKFFMAIAIAVATMFVWSGISFADGHCDKYANLKGKAWVDGDCMETPLGEKWWPTLCICCGEYIQK